MLNKYIWKEKAHECPTQKHWAENRLMQLLQEAKEVSLAIQKRAVASCQASLSRHLHCPPPPLLPAHVFANGSWWLARELTSSCLQVTSPEDSEFFVSRLSGLEKSVPQKGKEVQPLLGELLSFLAQLSKAHPSHSIQSGSPMHSP